MRQPSATEFIDPNRKQRNSRKSSPELGESRALEQLDALRQSLHQELEVLSSKPDYLDGQPADLCCTRQRNQMRLTPLEAKAILLAFQSERRLRTSLPQVIGRLRRELRHLKDNDQRQHFDCPLLENGLCLVHREAKPIGCLAWHPRVSSDAGSAEESPHFTQLGWSAFQVRDSLNDAVFGPDWKARVIPLGLRRIFATELARSPDRLE